MTALRYGPYSVVPDEAVKDSYILHLAAHGDFHHSAEIGEILLRYARCELQFEDAIGELGGQIAPISPVLDFTTFLRRTADAYEAIAERPATGVPLWFQRRFCGHGAKVFRRLADEIEAGLKGRAST